MSEDEEETSDDGTTNDDTSESEGSSSPAADLREAAAPLPQATDAIIEELVKIALK